jgi:hypothetical protein
MLTTDGLQRCTDYVLAKTRHVIESFGDRPPGSSGEAEAQALVKKELESCTDGEVSMEPFRVAPKAFMGVPRIAAVLLLAAVASTWISPWLALALSGMSVAVFALECIRYKLFLDPLFRKRTSYNVVGRQNPAGQATRRVILNAHPDAAYEWRLHYRCPGRLFRMMMLYLLATPFLKCIADVAVLALYYGAGQAYVDPWGVVGLVQFVFVPAGVIGLFFTNFRQVSPGANDDLSGTFIAIAVAKHLREADERLQNTELMILITGSEEAGLRGAKHYVKTHKRELQDRDTIVVTLDTIRDLDHLYVYNRDMNGMVRHDPTVCRLLRDAGARCGLDLPYASVYLGATDATAFTQEGIPAAALCAMDPSPADFYHTRRDNWDIMSAACIRKAIEVILEAIRAYDQNGLSHG